MKNLAAEITDRVQKFCLREEEIFHVIELADRRKALDYNSNEYADARGELLGFLSSLGDQKLQEMMCLMDFGRNIEYNGFDRGVAENFVAQVDTRHFSHIRGRNAVQYLAGKLPLGEWLRKAWRQVGTQPDDFFRILFFKSDVDQTQDYDKEAEAWAAFRALITVENAGVYDSIQLMGYSFTGRAETRMATVVF